MTSAIFLALAPIVVLIGLGMILRARRFLAESFWPQAERLAYFVLLPALFVHGLASADLGDLPALDLALTLILSILTVAGALVLFRPQMRIDGPGFTSIFQGGIRFNNYVGITLAAGLLGPKGVALAAICNAAIVPTVNVLCVLVFARNGQAKPNLRGVLRQLATNPLLVSCLVGVGLQLAGLRIPPGLDPAMKALGAASLPLGLLCVGAALEFHAARKWLAPVAISSSVKFVVLPLVTLGLGKAFGLQGGALTAALLFHALPTASSSYIMAKQLGGDAPLMAGITAIQTVLAFAAVPAALIAAAWLGAI